MNRSIRAQIPIEHAQQPIPLLVIAGLVTDRVRVYTFDRRDLFRHISKHGLAEADLEGSWGTKVSQV